MIEEVNKQAQGANIHQGSHRTLAKLFRIRPFSKEAEDPFDTNNKYCLYDGVHKDYVYTRDWINLIIKLINQHKWTRSSWRGKERRGEYLNPADYEAIGDSHL